MALIVSLTLFVSIAEIARSAPLLTSDLTIGPIRWKTDINVYIPLDPLRNNPDTPRTRHLQLVDAVNKWQAALAAAGLSLKITPTVLDANGNIPGTDKPPNANGQGNVTVSWVEPAGTAVGETVPDSTGEPTGKTDSKGDPLLKNESIQDAHVDIDQRTTDKGDVDNSKALATMLHELGHALGLKHEVVARNY